MAVVAHFDKIKKLTARISQFYILLTVSSIKVFRPTMSVVELACDTSSFC